MKAVAILEVMWDWRNVTTSAGYRDRAPRWFKINPQNHSGRRLHRWLVGYDFVATNACPQLVSSAKMRGTPSHVWLSANLHELLPMDLLLICGNVAQATFNECSFAQDNCRVLRLPHPAARYWNAAGIALVHETIRSGTVSGRIDYDRRTKQFTFNTLKTTCPKI